MGIKIKITTKDLPKKYQNFKLIPTKDGATDSVYLLGDKYVLKIYDDPNYNVEDEIILLNTISTLNVIQYVEHFCINKYTSIVYKYIAGESLYNPQIRHIKQIGIFLKDLHQKTQHVSSKNIQIFQYDYFKTTYYNRTLKVLQNYFDTIQIELQNDGVIHGDIFPDNVKWIDNKLSGVYDFSEACNGDFIFDLAVIASSWCFDDDKPNYEKIDALLCSYGLDISFDKFKEYIKYALVYYATTRYLSNRNFAELISRLESLKKNVEIKI